MVDGSEVVVVELLSEVGGDFSRVLVVVLVECGVVACFAFDGLDGGGVSGRVVFFGCDDGVAYSAIGTLPNVTITSGKISFGNSRFATVIVVEKTG